MKLNGFFASRNRNGPCVITDVTEEFSYQIGDIVILANNINFAKLSNDNLSNILASTNVISTMKVIHSYFIHTSKANDLLNSCRFYVKKVQSKQEHIDKRKEKDRVGKMSSQ